MGTKSFLDFMFLCSVCDFLFDVRGLQSIFCLSRHRYGPFKCDKTFSFKCVHDIISTEILKSKFF